MRKYLGFSSLLILLAVSSCADQLQREENISANEIMIINQSSNALPGQLMIKIKPTQTKAAGEYEDSRRTVMQIEELLQDVKKFKMEKLFPTEKRFEERTRKAGLDDWYIATYDKSIDNEAVVNQLKRCSGIVCVEYALPLKTFDYKQGNFSQHPTNNSQFPTNNPLVASKQTQVLSKATATYPFNESVLVRNRQWHYHNEGAVFDRPSLAGADAGVWEAWHKCTGNPDVIVAVIDHAVKYDHEDLADNMWINKSEIPGNGIDDDGNGYIDDVYGYNFIDNTGKLVFSDELTHGTHVAGTIAAVNNNGKGVNGIAGGSGKGDGVKIMSLQAIGKSEHSSGAGIGGAVRAMKYAADNGAVICQNSWGYGQEISWNNWSRGHYSVLRAAMDYFITYAGVDENGEQTGPMKGGIVIFAAGNDAVNWETYPAADPSIVSVSAISYQGYPALYTNYGEWVDIAAPGGDTYVDSQYGGVYSTVVAKDGSSAYDYMQGTSMACPHVSGACALAISYYYGDQKRKGLTPDMLKAALLSSSKDMTSLINTSYSGKMGIGLVNAAAMLNYMDYLEKAEDVTIKLGEIRTLNLSEYFPNTQTITWTIADRSLVEVSREADKLLIKALNKGETVLELSDAKALVKKIGIQIQ